jgi:very-short-patch-repair endonuclease
VVLTETRAHVVRVDFHFPATPVVVEVLGYTAHRGSRAQLARDAERLNALVMSGKCPIQFTYEHVTLESDWVVGEVRTALDRAA